MSALRSPTWPTIFAYLTPSKKRQCWRSQFFVLTPLADVLPLCKGSSWRAATATARRSPSSNPGKPRSATLARTRAPAEPSGSWPTTCSRGAKRKPKRRSLSCSRSRSTTTSIRTGWLWASTSRTERVTTLCTKKCTMRKNRKISNGIWPKAAASRWAVNKYKSCVPCLPWRELSWRWRYGKSPCSLNGNPA